MAASVELLAFYVIELNKQSSIAETQSCGRKFFAQRALGMAAEPISHTNVSVTAEGCRNFYIYIVNTLHFSTFALWR